jgi:VWFA-related protein
MLFALLFTIANSILAQVDPSADSVTESEEPSVFFESVDVMVVNVDVYVTDKQGNPVTGLTKDDFELFENGRPVELSNFLAVEGGRPAEQPSADLDETIGAVEKLPSESLAAASTLAEDQRLNLLIYFDNLFLKPFSRNKVIGELEHFLSRTLEPGDRVMLVTFERSLHVRVPFTDDWQELSAGLSEIEMLTGYAEQTATERRKVIQMIDHSRDEFEATSHVDGFAKAIHQDLLLSIRSLNELVGTLGGLSGRKAVLYVSDGIPMTPGEDLFYLVDNTKASESITQFSAAHYRARREFRDLTARANANRVSFYTLEAAGLRSHSSLSAEYGQRMTSIIEADVMWDANHEEPLLQMADDTGGLASLNTNNMVQALDSMQQDFDNYYSLGFAPAHSIRGRAYDLKVKLKRSGLRVRHRSGYRDKSPETRVNEGTMASLVYGIESNPLDVQLDLGEGAPVDRNRYKVPLLVRVPIAQMTLIPIQGRHRGSMRIVVGVIDEKGNISPLSQTPMPVDIPESDLPTAVQQEFVYEVELLMEEGLQVVAVGVRDEVAGDTSYVRKRIRVGSGA